MTRRGDVLEGEVACDGVCSYVELNDNEAPCKSNLRVPCRHSLISKAPHVGGILNRSIIDA
jgi:hypothetical protein